MLTMEAIRSSAFIVLNKNILRIMGFEAGVLFSYLVDKYRYWSHQDGFPGSFYCTHDTIQNELGLTDHKIREAKRALKDGGFVDIIKRGQPAKDHYVIDFIEVHRALVLEISKDKSLESSSTVLYNKNKEEEENITFSENLDQYKHLAKRLSVIVNTQKTIKHTPAVLLKWANEIRLLNEKDGVEMPRIRKALDWYTQFIGGQYIPVIQSGSSLREKFHKLENAMEREKVNGSSSQSKFVSKYKYKKAKVIG